MLIFTDRPGPDHTDSVTDLAGIILIVRFEFRHTSKHLSIERVNDRTLDLYDHRLIHLITDHLPDPLTPRIC